MKLLHQLKQALTPVNVSYRYYNKHKVDFQAKEREANERRLKEAGKRARGLL